MRDPTLHKECYGCPETDVTDVARDFADKAGPMQAKVFQVCVSNPG